MKNTLQAIQENEVYKQILKDSFGGIIYTVGTHENYDSKELLKLWDSLTDTYKDVAGGITKGVFKFLNNEN